MDKLQFLILIFLIYCQSCVMCHCHCDIYTYILLIYLYAQNNHLIGFSFSNNIYKKTRFRLILFARPSILVYIAKCPTRNTEFAFRAQRTHFRICICIGLLWIWIQVYIHISYWVLIFKEYLQKDPLLVNTVCKTQYACIYS